MRVTDPGRLQVRFSVALPGATISAPSVATLNGAGATNLIGVADGSEGMAEIKGFEEDTSSIPTPDFRSRRIGSIAGDTSYPDSTIEFYYDDTVTTIYTALAPDATGYITIAHDGVVAAKKVDIWPVTILKRSKPVMRDGAKKFVVTFALGVPTKDATLVA